MTERPVIREHVLLAPWTTIGLGGPARYFAECRSDDDIRIAIEFARCHSLPCIVLGGGSNVIVPDNGFDGLVLHVATTGIYDQTAGDDTVLVAAAGEQWDPLVALACRQHLAGLECLSGIPGSVGATPIQNVGAYGQEVGAVIVEVRAIDLLTLKETCFENPDCQFGYRTSRFKQLDAGSFVITQVSFRLRPGGQPVLEYPELKQRIAEFQAAGEHENPATIGMVRDAVIRLRRSKGMVIDPDDPDSRSVGSFFTNPIVGPDSIQRLKHRWPEIPCYPSGTKMKLSAAWLVEHAGFTRGFRMGGAAVSGKHSLALVNRGTTASELLQLADLIQQTVHSKFGILLEREPVLMESNPHRA